MATVRKWSGVAVAMQSAIAATKTITAITKANPGVASCTANGYSNGDFVLISAQGMSQVDSKVVRVSGAATDSFSLEGVDTTNYTTFSSGTAAKLTFGTSITTATSMSAAGGTFDFLDVTTIHDLVKRQIPGQASAITFTFDNLWDMSDAGQLAMKAASDSQAQMAFRFTFGVNGPIWTFNGYVGFTGAPAGNAQGIVTSQAVITSFGLPTGYAS